MTKDRTTQPDETRTRSPLSALRRRWQTVTARGDAGMTVAELLVVMAMMAVLAGLVAGGLHSVIHNGQQGVTRTTVHGSLLDASSLLARDVKEAQWLHVATETELSLSVVRDGVCWNRDYKIEHNALTVTTLYFEQRECRGASDSKTETLVDDATKATHFTYFGASDNEIQLPIDDLRAVERITWDLAAKAAGWTQPLEYSGASVFTGQGDHSGTSLDVEQADRALLKVTTGVAEGAADPILSWTDPNDPGVVTQWTLLRSAIPEGADASADVARGTWQAISPPLPAATTTWTDTTLPPGYTASYAVRPTVAAGLAGATESNVVVTGRRPAQVAGLTATGRPTSVDLAWSAAVGATGYDIYRDSVLVAHVGKGVRTFADGPGVWGWDGDGYGHSHNYAVVAVNRWELLTTTGAQSGSTPIGDELAKAYPRIGSTRLASAPAGAFTAPDAPSLVVTPNSDWSYTLSWGPAPWVGAGPTTVGTHRDRGWTAAVNASTTETASAAWSALWGGAETARTTPARTQSYSSAIAGQWRSFRIQTCNTSGCSPDSLAISSLQRPPAPASCTPTGSTTRSVAITVNPAASNSPNVAFRVDGGAGSPVGGAPQAGKAFTIDQLTHSTTSTFTAHSQNASAANGGWSDGTACQGTTDALTISAPTVTTRTTRTIAASFAAGNGVDRNLTLENVGTSAGTSGTWDPLADGAGYTLTARNSDGWNAVSAQTATSTVGLTAPSCSVSGGGTAPNGTISVTSSGGNGSGRQVSAGAGWVTASGTSRSGLAAGTYVGWARSTDGYNTSGSVNCGAVTVKAWVETGAPSGAASASCSPLLGIGAVKTALDAAISSAGGRDPYGNSISTPVNGSAADLGVYASGTPGSDLSCTFYREHWVVDGFGNHIGTWWASTRYTQGGGGGAV